MCGVSEPSRRSRALPRPGWGGLYVVAGLMFTALAIVETLVAPGTELTALQRDAAVRRLIEWTGATARVRA